MKKIEYKYKIRICPICKKEFQCLKDYKDRKQIYCSRRCFGLSIAKIKRCKNCGKDFYNWQNKYFCSMKCAGEYKRGKKFSEKHIKALSEAKKGKPQPQIHNPKVYEKISKSLRGKPQPWNRNERHHEWKGDKAGYTAFHQWLRRKFGKATMCDNPDCHYPRRNRNNQILYKPKRFEWSLIHGKKHDHKRENYWQLCKSCHVKYDMEK